MMHVAILLVPSFDFEVDSRNLPICLSFHHTMGWIDGFLGAGTKKHRRFAWVLDGLGHCTSEWGQRVVPVPLGLVDTPE